MTSDSPKKRRYVPAVGPRLAKVLALVFGLLALIAINSTYLVGVSLMEFFTGRTYQNWFYMNMFLVHLILGALIILPVIVFGIAHMRNAYDRRNRRAVKVGYRALRHGSGAAGQRRRAHPARRRHRGQGSGGAQRRLLGPRRHAAGGGLALRAPSPGGQAHQLAGGAPLGLRGGRLRRPHAGVAGARSAALERRGSDVGRAVLLPVPGAHRHRRLHPREGADERRLLRRMPRGQPSHLGVERAPLQLVQQSALPLLGAQHARGRHEARRRRAGRPVLRRLPRSGGLLLRQIRRSRVRRRPRSHLPGRNHLHCLPRHHERQQSAGQLRLHHRRAGALSLRLCRERDAAVGEPPAGEGQTGVPQAHLPEAAAPEHGVLWHLPQGASARGAEQVQVAAGPEPLRRLPAFRRLGPRHHQLLLPAEGRGELQRLPHADAGVDAIRCPGLRRRWRSRGPRPYVPQRQYRHPAAGGPGGVGQRGPSSVQRGRDAGRHLRPQGGQRHRRRARRAAASGGTDADSGPGSTSSTWWCGR